MPTLGLKGSSEEVISRLHAVMLFPNDDEARSFFFAHSRASNALDAKRDTESISIAAKSLRIILKGPPQQFEASRISARKSGLIAGELLAIAYATPAEEVPSINKAIHVFKKWAKENTWITGEPMPTSESRIREAWSSHKSVAHLWAAMRINHQGFYRFSTGEEQMFTKDRDTFLRLAAAIFQFGCRYVPPYTKPPRPLLDRSECWCLPAHIKPAHPDSMALGRLVELLKGYKAPRQNL